MKYFIVFIVAIFSCSLMISYANSSEQDALTPLTEICKPIFAKGEKCIVFKNSMSKISQQVLSLNGNAQTVCGSAPGMGTLKPGGTMWEYSFASLKNYPRVNACLTNNPSYPKSNFTFIFTDTNYISLGFPGSRTANVTISDGCASVPASAVPADKICVITFTNLKTM